MRFILLRVLVACGIMSILWNYALPFKALKQGNEPIVTLQEVAQKDRAQKIDQEESFAVGLNQLIQKTASPQGSRLLLFVLAFFLGILMSFTPCVYPLIPITVGILRTSAASTLLSNFISACSYASGLTLTYAMLGYAVARASLIFGQWLSNPWIVVAIVFFLLYLAFSLFGFYALYIPQFLKQGRGLPLGKKSRFRIFTFGIISGLIASPCVTPGLAGILAIIVYEKNPLVGFLTMLFFSMGMSVLLLVIGTFSSSLSLLPRSGMWMIEIERIIGFFLLALSVYFIEALVGASVTWWLYGAVVLGIALYYLRRFFS